MPELGKFYTPPEVGRLLGMKPDTIIKLIRAGAIKSSNVAVRLSGRPRFRIAAEDLRSFLDARAAAAVSAPAPRRRRKQQRRPEGWISYFGMSEK